MRITSSPLSLITVFCFMLLLSSSVFAQNNCGRNERNGRYSNHYNAARTRVRLALALTLITITGLPTDPEFTIGHLTGSLTDTIILALHLASESIYSPLATAVFI